MNYNKTELRNNHLPLLRRLQRQVEVENEKREFKFKKEKKEKKEKKDKFGSFLQEDEDFCFLKVKNTQLNLRGRKK